MSITLHNLHPNKGATKTKKRLGRGRGSGTGKTSGKGVKGQKARPGHHGARFAFEGGQMPMPRRIPKRGFKAPNRVEAHPINVAQLEQLFDAGAMVDLAALQAKGSDLTRARIALALAGWSASDQATFERLFRRFVTAMVS